VSGCPHHEVLRPLQHEVPAQVRKAQENGSDWTGRVQRKVRRFRSSIGFGMGFSVSHVSRIAASARADCSVSYVDVPNRRVNGPTAVSSRSCVSSRLFAAAIQPQLLRLGRTEQAMELTADRVVALAGSRFQASPIHDDDSTVSVTDEASLLE
jgi:hypothetical protein